MRKNNFILKNKKGQSFLEGSIVIVMIILLFGGIINIWFWSSKQLVERQIKYNNSRVEAGTASGNYELVWPVYAPEELSEDKVILDGP